MKNLFIVFGAVFASLILFSCSTPSEEEQAKTKIEIDEFKKHHIQDSHDFILFEDLEAHKYFGFHLPVILWDGGLKIFSSRKFHWGHKVAEVDGAYYKIHHGKIYRSDALGNIQGAHDDEETHAAHASSGELSEHHSAHADETAHSAHESEEHSAGLLLDFSITKNVVFIILACGLLFLMFTGLAKSYKKNPVPSGFGKFLEPIIVYVRDEIALPNIGEKHYKKYMPYLLTVFFFIWIVNLFGLTPFGSNVTNSISVTFFLAIVTFVITQVTAKKDYWMHIFWMPGVPVPMKFILAPIELLGIFIKPFALMIRLYANITAGHIVMMSLIGLIFIYKNLVGGGLSFALAFAISLIEFFVAALQAYIFTMLSALYFGSASEEHSHDEAH